MIFLRYNHTDNNADNKSPPALSFNTTFPCPHCQTLLRPWQRSRIYAFPCPACGIEVTPPIPAMPVHADFPLAAKISCLRKEPTRPVCPERLAKLKNTRPVPVRELASIPIETRYVTPRVSDIASQDSKKRQGWQTRFAFAFQTAAAITIGIAFYLVDPLERSAREPEIVPVYRHNYSELPGGMINTGSVPVMIVDPVEESERPSTAQAYKPRTR